MLKRGWYGILVSLLVLSSCVGVRSPETRGTPPAGPRMDMPQAVPSGLRDTHEMLYAVLWMQTSAEFRALSRSVYVLARKALDAALAAPGWTAALEQQGRAPFPDKTAIILDIDETVLDNSPYEAQLILDGKPYDEAAWKKWVLQGKANEIPGALEFVRYAQSLGVTVFYISGRDAEIPGDHISPQEQATRRNLEALGFAFPPGEDTVLLKNENQGWGSDKSSRRAYVAQSYRILLLIGDDLGDFLSGVKTDIRLRKDKAEERQDLWGRGWIVLPNAMYGSWEGALFGYDQKLTDEQALRLKKSRLRGTD